MKGSRGKWRTAIGSTMETTTRGHIRGPVLSMMGMATMGTITMEAMDTITMEGMDIVMMDMEATIMEEGMVTTPDAMAITTTM